MSELLFDEFQEVSARQWKQKIQADLRGADYNETLIWQSLEGINVKPFYHQDDFKQPFYPVPGQPVNWEGAQAIFIHDEGIANKLAIDAIDRGVQAIWFNADVEFDPAKVLESFPFNTTSLYFKFNFLSEEFHLRIKKFLEDNSACFHLNVDIIGNLVRSGNWFKDLKTDHSILESIMDENTLGIDLTVYHNSGANKVQELAYALAHANEYLNHFFHENHHNSVKKDELTLNFNLAVGSNYFFEIAKIRALRILYATLAEEYNINPHCHIVATPSRRNKTLYDYNVNMLRTTTECMSAIIGGANTIVNLPYDAIYHKSNEFGERMARNQLHILRSESYFSAVSNSSDGSYFIENLTHELVEKSLELFKEIERSGGFLNQLKAGTIQKKVKESAAKEQALFDSGDLKLLGTNFQPNESDRMKDNIELFPFVKIKPRKTLLEPLIQRRLAEATEQKRLDDE